ncbi:hypothetical protein CLCR_09187 [Cladophialophora carrionii]|uniref:Uncharacterized protein n=1 Tax=Cladophialophora carrionii TaxID=86049 RepID=A0A1C1CTL1_9EURO|nr:hypothetical protein CLCR_09187 [Cladophialophora carrionii]
MTSVLESPSMTPPRYGDRYHTSMSTSTSTVPSPKRHIYSHEETELRARRRHHGRPPPPPPLLYATQQGLGLGREDPILQDTTRSAPMMMMMMMPRAPMPPGWEDRYYAGVVPTEIAARETVQELSRPLARRDRRNHRDSYAAKGPSREKVFIDVDDPFWYGVRVIIVGRDTDACGLK